MNIRRRIQLTVMCMLACDTGPDAITQGDVMIDKQAGTTHLGRREPAVDMRDDRSQLVCDVVQDIDETGKPQIRYLAAPQGFHPLQVERFETDRVIRLAQVSGGLPVEVSAEMCHPAMHTGEVSSGFGTVVRPRPFRRKLSVGPGKLPESSLERLRSGDRLSLLAREIGTESEVKARAFTRRDPLRSLRTYQTGEIDVQLTQGITLDGHCFDGAIDVSGPGELIDRAPDAQQVAPEQLPSGLRERERSGLGDLAERRRAYF